MLESVDFSEPLECDVVIAGAGLAGLVTGAILARHGRRVVVVDRNSRIGGRGGSTPHRGYWLDGGQRDGSDVGDLQVGWRYGQLAAREAEVEVPLRIVDPAIRVHHLLGDSVSGDESRGASVYEGSWGSKGFLRMARDVFGCPEPAIPDLAAAMGKLVGASPQQRRAAVPVPLPRWLAENVRDEDVRRALLTMVTVVYCEHPERASAGRVMGFFAPRDDLPPLQTAFPDHPDVGGMQGLVLPFARAVEARGGRLLLGLAPSEVVFEGTGDAQRAVGLVALDESHLALEVRARHTVLAAPVWEAITWVPARRVAPELASLADTLADEQAEAIAWQAGLRRLPRLHATGEVESHLGWNRVLTGPERRYSGGFHIPSQSSRATAPPGKHLLHAFVARWLRRGERVDWPEAREAIDRVTAHLRRFYVDLDECVEWSGLQRIERPACLAWYWAPIVRHGVGFPGCERLWLASTTFESEAGPVDIAAHAGLEAAHAILESDRA